MQETDDRRSLLLPPLLLSPIITHNCKDRSSRIVKILPKKKKMLHLSQVSTF
nr:MAG TPA: hypothetical protein [Caudoviricetes sp.]